MELRKAFRLHGAPCLAFVGAGGKSTAVFTLARELAPPVIVSATTHLARHQLAWADWHLTVRRPEEVEALSLTEADGVVLLTGPLGEDDRTQGLHGGALQAVRSLAGQLDRPLLLEADGARQRAVKAPAPHEPALPPWVDEVVVVSGLHALGRPIRAAWVHRPDRFAALVGQSPGAAISQEALVRILISPDGGLKGIPARARRVALLTHAAPARREAAEWIAREVLSAYRSVSLAVQGGEEQGAEPGGQGPRSGKSFQPLEVIATHERIAGVVLAAGEATRMGGAKQVLNWKGMPMVRRVAQTALEGGLSPVLVVTGAYAAQVSQAVEGMPVRLVHNPDWRKGQSTSVKVGVDSLPQDVGGVVFSLSDQPQIPAGLVRALRSAHRRTLAPLVAPRVEGQRGNPVLFDRDLFDELLALEGDVGGRALFQRHRCYWVPWDDPTIRLDVDTPEDFGALREASSSEQQ